MIKTREYFSLPTRIVLGLSFLLVAIAVVIIGGSFALRGQILLYDSLSFIIVMLSAVILSGLIFVTLGLSVEYLAGIPWMPGDREQYIDSYLITNLILLTCQKSTLNTKKSLTTGRIYVQYSYQELEAFYRIMRRNKSAGYILPTLRLPAPIGDFTIKISRRTIKRLLMEMSSTQYVVLSRTVEFDYLGETLIPAQSGYVSRREIRRILCHPQWMDQGQVTVYGTVNQRIQVDVNTINAWSAQLQEEGQYVPVNLSPDTIRTTRV